MGKKRQEPRFIFKSYSSCPEDDGNHYRVSVAFKDDDQFGRPLCEVVDSFGENKWRITATTPSDYHGHVMYAVFPTKEVAAHFFYSLHQRSEALNQIRQLPDDLVQYLEDRARHLRSEEEETGRHFIQVRHERYALNQFASRNQLKTLDAFTDDADPGNSVRKLLSFSITGEGKDKIPFFSETSLYELIGKNAARTLRSLLRKVCQEVAPNVVEELL